MKYEQIVNKIIFILFFRTYIEARYIALRYIMSSWTIASVKDFYLTCYIAASRQVFLLDKISYNLSCKNAENTSYSDIFPNIPQHGGVFYIIKHLFDCKTRAMCSTHTSRSKSHITYHSPHLYIINCIKFPHNSL